MLNVVMKRARPRSSPTARADRGPTKMVATGAVSCACVAEEFKSPSPLIASGICFLDHMIDQFTSHAMIGITLQTTVDGVASRPHADFSQARTSTHHPHDAAVFRESGRALGAALRALLPQAPSTTQTFCAPLDEAFVEVTVAFSGSAPSPADVR